jgi:citrate synthase
MSPGVIEHRGVPVEQIIEERGFVSSIYFLTLGAWPTPGQARLLEAALVGSMDHGPQAPSIAIARMAITCGIGINNAMASAVNALGDLHGGAAQQAVELFNEIVAAQDAGDENAVAHVVAAWQARSKYLPGFGHRFHRLDPRRAALLGLLDHARAAGEIAGRHLDAALGVEALLGTRRDRSIPMNIDGATGAIYAELGVPPELSRGLFVLSRSVGILAHAWEERQSGLRNKGPIPRSILPTFIPPNTP